MKILSLSTSDLSGGAGKASFRLHQGLRQIGMDSWILVQDKRSDDNCVIGPKSKLNKVWCKIKPYIDSLPLFLYKTRESKPFNLQWSPGFYSKIIERMLVLPLAPRPMKRTFWKVRLPLSITSQQNIDRILLLPLVPRPMKRTFWEGKTPPHE